jgi:carboxymethylenebutenolidase
MTTVTTTKGPTVSAGSAGTNAPAVDAITAGTIRIAGDGGDEIEAYEARPLAPGSRGGVVVIHHRPGYDAASKEIVRTFAVLGFNAICPNLFWRDAPGASPDDAAAASRAVGGVSDERLIGDVAGAAAALRALESSNGRVGTIGYCSGGRQSVLAACNLPLDAAVDCYGAFVVEPVPEDVAMNVVPILDQMEGLSCPLLGLFGADDAHPSPDAVAALHDELERLGKPHDFHTFTGAGHAFFAVDRPSYRPEAAVEGWSLIADWFGRYLSGSSRAVG